MLFATLTSADNEMVVKGLEEGEHHFHITSLYQAEIDGEMVTLESPLSNKATIVTDIAQAVDNGIMRGDVLVYTIGGAKVAEGKVSERLPKGTYVVVDKLTKTASRIIVK